MLRLAGLATVCSLARSDIVWPEYSQACQDEAGPPYGDDEEHFPGGGKYHDLSAAQPVLQADGTCAPPLRGACQSRPTIKTAYMEGPIDCSDNGWYCRIMPDPNWPPLNLLGDLNFGHCNSTDSFDHHGYDQDGHCHGSNKDNTYYWWMRDHFHREYNGRLRCCCGWYEGTSSTPMYGRRIANRCDFRRQVTPSEDLAQCRDANEEHGLGFDDIGCDAQYQSAQLGQPVPEDDDICWEISRFGATEETYDTPTVTAATGDQSDESGELTNTDESTSTRDDDTADERDDHTTDEEKGQISGAGLNIVEYSIGTVCSVAVLAITI